MTLKQYFPISVAAFVAVISLIEYLNVPAAPFAFVLLTAETLIGFQLEDHRIPKYIASIFRAPKHHAH